MNSSAQPSNFFNNIMLFGRVIIYVIAISGWLAFVAPPPELTYVGILLSCFAQALVFFLIFNREYYAQKTFKNYFLINFICLILTHCIGIVLYQHFH
jgi:hypothetical protein